MIRLAYGHGHVSFELALWFVRQLCWKAYMSWSSCLVGVAHDGADAVVYLAEFPRPSLDASSVDFWLSCSWTYGIRGSTPCARFYCWLLMEWLSDSCHLCRQTIGSLGDSGRSRGHDGLGPVCNAKLFLDLYRERTVSYEILVKFVFQTCSSGDLNGD